MNPVIRKLIDNINELNQELQNSSAVNPVNQEVNRVFRGSGTGQDTTGSASSTGPGNNPAISTSTLDVTTRPPTGQSVSNTPRFRLGFNFNTRGRSTRIPFRKKAKGKKSTYFKDVILLGGPKDDIVPRQGRKLTLMENKHIINSVEIDKNWEYLVLLDKLKSLFPEKIGEFDDIEILMPVHHKLVPPQLSKGQTLNATVLQKVFKDKAIYIRPQKDILDVYEELPSKKKYEVDSSSGEPYASSDDDQELLKSVFKNDFNCTIKNGKTSTGTITTPNSTATSNTITALDTVTATINATTNNTEFTNTVSSNTVASNTVASNTVASNTVASNTVASNTVSSNTVASNTATTTLAETRSASFTWLTNSVGTDSEEAIAFCIRYCQERNIENPVELLRCLQQHVMTGRSLDVTDPSLTLEGDSNCIFIDRLNVLSSALEEMEAISDPRKPISVSFYGEEANDCGGPRREFFRLCLKEIEEKYFKSGLKPHLADDYSDVGLIMAMSVIQNGSIPRFLSEAVLQELFTSDNPCECIKNLRKGFSKVGLLQMGEAIPNFLHLFRPSPSAVLSRSKLLQLLAAQFSPEGSNARIGESEVYGAFKKYCLKAASGQRGSVSLNHVLQFTTGADEEPPLGFATSPHILFVEADDSEAFSFIPTANTCSNSLYLRRPSNNIKLPDESSLFNVFDYAFSNAYFGKI